MCTMRGKRLKIPDLEATDVTEVRDNGSVDKDEGSGCGWVLKILNLKNNQNLVLSWM